MFEKRKGEISRRKAEIRRMLESGKDDAGNAIDLDALTTEINALNDELADLERRENAIKGMGGTAAAATNAPTAIANPITENGSAEPPAPVPEGRAILATPEYRSAFAKMFLRRAMTPAEQRALDTAVTTTATQYTAPTAGVDGVNNGGLFIPTDINLSLMERIGLVSPIFKDIHKTSVPGLLNFPYRKTVSKAKNVKESTKTPEMSVEWANLTLALSEIAATIAVSWRLIAMAINEFFNYLLDELSEQIEEKSINEVIYGLGGTADPGQMKGITADAVSYQYEGTALDGIGVALGKFTDKRHKVGAKIYVSPSIMEEIAFTKNTVGDYIHNPINGVGVNSVAGYKVESDPYLNDGDFIIGNISRFYRMNEHEALSLAIDTSGKTRRDDYTAWGLWSGALQPGTVIYGKKKTTT
jgi:HK97 family phage major capsid protein